MSPPPSEESTTSDDRLYFRQLLSGRDFGTADRVAQQMVNFVYLIGDQHTREAVIVDPAYDVAALLQILEADGMRCTGVLATHYHPDHVGGSMMGFDIAGVKELLDEVSVPVHAQHEEIHTPGHTPGSQCFLVDNRLVAGDTLFLEGCGRTDLPGGDPAALYRSITQKLAKVPDDAVLYPGHLYSPQSSATMGHTRESNFVYKPRSEEQWIAMFGR